MRIKNIPSVFALSVGLFFLTIFFVQGAVITPPPTYLPTATLTASPNPLYVRGAGITTLTWSSTNATSCVVTQGEKLGFDTSGATSGSDSSDPISSATTFTISCTGFGGTALASVTVSIGGVTDPPDTIPVSGLCSANRTTATTGQSVTWTAVPSGGTGSYTYSWSGTSGLSGSSISTSKTYSTAGIKTASVVITSNGELTTVNCSNSVVVSALTHSNFRRMPVACVSGQQPALVPTDFLGMGMKEAGPWLNAITGYLRWMTKKLDDAGVSSTVVGLSWGTFEAQNNVFNWYNDIVFEELSDVGIKPVADISSTPAWASSHPNDEVPSAWLPNDINDWKDAVRKAVQHYGPSGTREIKDWKIWNEPNGTGFWRGTREEFITLLNAAYTTIKQEDPNARVWAPGVVYHENNAGSAGYNNPDAWVDHIIANGQFDVFTIHLYYRDPIDMRDTVRSVRQKLDDVGKQNIPLSVTEFNIFDQDGIHCPYGDLSESQQAQNLSRAYACIAEGGADSAHWFTATDRPNNNPAISCPGGWIRTGVFTRVPVAEKLSYGSLRDIGVALGTATTQGDGDDGDDDDGGGGGGAGTGGSDDPVILMLMEKLVTLLMQYIQLLLVAKGQ